MHRAPVLLTVLALSFAACGGSERPFCEQAADFQRGDFGTGGDIEEDITDALETMDDLIEAAPGEVVTDLVVVRDGVEDFVRGGQPDPEFGAASLRVSRYLEEECDLAEEDTP